MIASIGQGPGRLEQPLPLLPSTLSAQKHSLDASTNGIIVAMASTLMLARLLVDLSGHFPLQHDAFAVNALL